MGTTKRPSQTPCSPAPAQVPVRAPSAAAPTALVSLAAALLLPGCYFLLPPTPPPEPPAPPEAPAPPPTTSEVDGDDLIRTYDLNHDGRPDDWKHFKVVPDLSPDLSNVGKPPREVLLKRELDTNFDGKPDITTWYDDHGVRTQEAFDLDFDGHPDVINHYEKGILVRKESFRRTADKADGVATYEGGKKVRVERDTRGRGKVDTWEYFEGGRLSRVGEDVDGDGLVDRWLKAKEGSDEEAPRKTAAAPGKKKDGASPIQGDGARNGPAGPAAPSSTEQRPAGK